MGLTFFEQFKVPKNKSIGITNLLSNITTREGSHKGGWTRLLRCQLKYYGYDNVKILTNTDSLKDFDVIIFDLGAEYSGALNLFGGLDEKVFNRLTEIKEFTGQIFSWKNSLPSLTVLESRRNNESTCGRFKSTGSSFLSDVQQTLSTCRVFRHAYISNHLLIGDSHTPGIWTPEWMIERQDGRTLYGTLKKAELNPIVDMFGTDLHVMVQMSSIDIRHHLCRQDKPEISTAELASVYLTTLNDLRGMAGFRSVTIAHTMGIEDESRELPKTGYYKGTPFYGSWEERNKLRNIFNTMVDELSVHFGYDVIKYPEYFFDETSKLKFDVMERPGSVHISPEHYRWDLNKNELRWTEFHDLNMKVKYATLKISGDLEKAMYEP